MEVRYIHHAAAAEYTRPNMKMYRERLWAISILKGSKMKGNFKYSRFNDLEQQIQIESHKINVECIFFKPGACNCDTVTMCAVL